MVQLLIEVKNKKSNEIKKVTLIMKENTIVISDQFFYDNILDVNWFEDIYYIGDIHIDCNQSTIIVEKFSLAESFCLFSFSDTQSHVSIMKCNNINLHLVGVDVKHLELEKGNILIADLNVGELYIDSSTFMIQEEDTLQEDFSNVIDVRRATIEKLIFHQSPKAIVFVESNIKEITGHKRGKKPFEIGLFSVYKSNVECIYIGDNIEKLQIQESYVKRLFFQSTTSVNVFENSNSDIYFVNECKKEMFQNPNIDTWQMIKQGNHKKNLSVYSEAGFWHDKLQNFDYISKEKSKLKKISMYISDWFLRICNGYGYKPLNAVAFSVICIIGFGFLYSLIDLIFRLPIEHLRISMVTVKSGFNWIFQNIYLSGISFTTIGFGEFGSPSWICRILMVFEGCLGVATLSLFVAALLKKYTE